MVYHVDFTTGLASKCSSKIICQYGGPSNHFPTPELAIADFEAKMRGELFETLSSEDYYKNLLNTKVFRRLLNKINNNQDRIDLHSLVFEKIDDEKDLIWYSKIPEPNFENAEIFIIVDKSIPFISSYLKQDNFPDKVLVERTIEKFNNKILTEIILVSCFKLGNENSHLIPSSEDRKKFYEKKKKVEEGLVIVGDFLLERKSESNNEVWISEGKEEEKLNVSFSNNLLICNIKKEKGSEEKLIYKKELYEKLNSVVLAKFFLKVEEILNSSFYELILESKRADIA